MLFVSREGKGRNIGLYSKSKILVIMLGLFLVLLMILSSVQVAHTEPSYLTF